MLFNKKTKSKKITFTTASGYVIDPEKMTVKAPNGEDINYVLLNREIMELRRLDEDARKWDMRIVDKEFTNVVFKLNKEWRLK